MNGVSIDYVKSKDNISNPLIKGANKRVALHIIEGDEIKVYVKIVVIIDALSS